MQGKIITFYNINRKYDYDMEDEFAWLEHYVETFLIMPDPEKYSIILVTAVNFSTKTSTSWFMYFNCNIG